MLQEGVWYGVCLDVKGVQDRREEGLAGHLNVNERGASMSEGLWFT